MRYLTYDEYLNVGGALEKTAFERVIVAACAMIDSYTQWRLHYVSKISENVQACVRDLCEYIYNDNCTSSFRTLASKSQAAGGVSESETYTIKSGAEVKAELWNTVFTYLYNESDDNGTPLLYRGCMA